MSFFAPLMIAQGVLGVAGGITKARATNKAAKQNFANAQVDAAFQFTQNNRRHIEQDRAARQAGYDAALATRASVASARNSAAAGGVTGNTMRALVAEELRTGARNQSRIEDQRSNNLMATLAESKRIESQTQSRINQTPTASFGITDFAKIALGTALGIQSHRDGMSNL